MPPQVETQEKETTTTTLNSLEDLDTSVLFGDDDKPNEEDEEQEVTSEAEGSQEVESESSEEQEVEETTVEEEEGEDGTEGDEDEFDTSSFDDDSSEAEVQEVAKAGELSAEELAAEADSRKAFYEKFLPGDVEIAKDLRNEAFNKVKDILVERAEKARQLEEYQKQVEELKTSSSQPFYAHEEGYTLLPEYRQLDAQYTQVEQVEQLANRALDAEDGAEVTVFVGMRDNKPQYEKYEMSPQLRAKLTVQATQLAQRKGELYSAANNIASNYKQSYTSAIEKQSSYYKTVAEKLKPIVPSEEQVKAYMQRTVPAQLQSLPGQKESAAKDLMIANLVAAYKKLHTDHTMLKNGKLALKAQGPSAKKLKKAPAKESEDFFDVSKFMED